MRNGSPEIRRKTGGSGLGIGHATRFKKGQSGNPGGRPKTSFQFAEATRAFLQESDRLPQLLERMYKEDPKTLLAYAFGKPAENVSMNVTQIAGLPDEVLEGLQKLFRRTAYEEAQKLAKANRPLLLPAVRGDGSQALLPEAGRRG